MGGPSAAIVFEELIALGANRLVRIGTCGALDPELALGALLAAERVLPADGTSARAGSRARRSSPTPACSRGSWPPAPVRSTVASSDLFYDPREDAARAWAEPGRRGRGDGGGHDLPDRRAGAGSRRRASRGSATSASRARRCARAWRRRSWRSWACGSARPATRPSGVRDREPLLRARHRLAAGSQERRQRGDVAGDLVESRLDPREPVAAGRPRRAPTRSSRRSIESSIPSSRCESERSRRVTRSMSAAEGRLSAPMAASCAWTAFSRASKARAIAAFTTGFEISSSAILPSASSPWRESRSHEALVLLWGSPSRRQGTYISGGREAHQGGCPRGSKSPP